MPHLRIRYVTARVKKSLRFSSIVGLLGQRQVGKTTVLEGLAASYSTFDKEGDLLEAEENPEAFLQNRKPPFGIDESQICPRLFPALKEEVRKNKKPGQYLLSGSVRFTSRKLIRESLTGRIVNLEILPFTIREANACSLPELFLKIAGIQNEGDLLKLESNKEIQNRKTFHSYLDSGGLPGICFFRDRSIRNQKFEAHIDTLLNRDIHLIMRTTLPYTSLRGLLKYLAINQGASFELKSAAEYSQISTVTLKKIIFAFESLFLIRAVTSMGPEKKPVYFLEDQGMATWLTEASYSPVGDIQRGVYSNLRQEFYYNFDLNGSIHHYRSKHGVNVPLVFKSVHGLIGVIPCPDSRPAPKTLGSALGFLKKHPQAIVIIAIQGDEPVLRAKNLFFIPYYWLV